MRYLNLSDTEMVSLKTIIACLAFFVVVITSCACMAMSIKVDASFLWPIFALICAFAGINAAAFMKYRTTDYKAIELQGDADAKVAAATKAQPAQPVVQSPAPAVEIHS